MNKLRVMVVTVSRADYGILVPLIKRFKEDACFDLRLVASGTHLSEIHGETINVIRADGFEVSAEIDITPAGDTGDDICKAIASGLEAFSGLYKKEEPDFIVILGDRYELWSVSLAAVIYRIPIVHIHGGEVTFGAIDETVRHSVTKIAALHFPSVEIYRKRIIQMGENPGSVYAVGALGMDNIKEIGLMSIDELSDYCMSDFKSDMALMTYHPVTFDQYRSSSVQIREVLDALLETELNVLITMTNSDPGWKPIYEAIQYYTGQYSDRFKLVKNLGQKAYFSAMKYAKLLIGNSSSGIIESASFKLPVVNIGDRQDGRFRPGNVIDCSCEKTEISKAITKALSEQFASSLEELVNPYGDGNTADRIMQIIKLTDFRDKDKLLKKKFYDIDF